LIKVKELRLYVGTDTSDEVFTIQP